MDGPRQILVVDDEPDLVDLVRFNLERRGYEVLAAGDGREALAIARERRPDLAIVDVMMPEMDGIELVRRLRGDPRLSAIAILVLTARTDERDELQALTVGADDYVPKPFSIRVLLARVESLLRRADTGGTPDGDELTLGPVVVDLRRHEAFMGGRALSLTRTEFRILSALIAAEGRVLTRSDLIARAIGLGVAVTKRTIDVHVTSLRRKLGEASSLIETVRGVGYRVADPDERSASSA